MLYTALRCGDAAFASAYLTTETAALPPIRILPDEPGAPPLQSGTIRCHVRGDAGLAFTLPSAMVAARGGDQYVTRFLRTLPLFVECLRRHPKLEGTTVLDVADAARPPAIGYCARTPGIALVPDTDFMASHGYQETRDFLAAHRAAWSERRQVAFWRGASTGHGDGSQPRWAGLQRVKLCQAVQGADAALFDVGISRLQLPPDDPGREEIPRLGLMRPFVGIREFQNFRYQIDIDGYTSAWSALFQKLLTGSTVLKVESPRGWRQWYYDRLTPWETHVPVAADLSDLAEKTRWLIAHDDTAERIGQAGRALAESLTYERELPAGADVIAEAIRVGEAKARGSAPGPRWGQGPQTPIY